MKEAFLFSARPEEPVEGEVWVNPETHFDRLIGRNYQKKYRYENGKWIYIGREYL